MTTQTISPQTTIATMIICVMSTVVWLLPLWVDLVVELLAIVKNICDIVLDVGGTDDVLLDADESTTQETATSSLCTQLWTPHPL